MKNLGFTISMCTWISVIGLFGQVPQYDPSQIVTDVPPVICPVGDGFHFHHVPPKKTKRAFKTKALQIIPIYDADMPEAAIKAIDSVLIPIVASTFSSEIPIHVAFSWDQTPAGALAAANATSLRTNFTNDLRIFNVWYSVALAEKIARRDINEPGEADISVSINKNAQWCYDCSTPEEVGANRFDFPGTILHEIYHGLGFSGISNVEGGLGTQTVQGISGIYNSFLENQAGQRTILQTDGSPELANDFTSGNLLFNIPTSTKARLYSPTVYERGSSVSHLDDRTFDGTANSLMTSAAMRGTVERSGGIADDMLYDMGWLYTHMIHEIADVAIENPVDQDYTVELEIISDNGYQRDSLRLHYSSDGFVTEDIIVAFDSLGNGKYQAVIPSPGVSQVVSYYMEVTDNRDLRFSSPGVNFTGNQLIHQYAFGPDDIDPVLTHTPIKSIKTVDVALDLFVNSTDEFAGLDTILIDWQINGDVQEQIGMVLDSADLFEDDRYIATLTFPRALTEEDVLEYRIVARDASSKKNETASPETGFYNVAIIPINAPQSEYINDFNNESDDFDFLGFSIAQPNGFGDGALHTDHPYEVAGANRTLSLSAELKVPIILKEQDMATMIYNEIVLVEPSDPGKVFGDTEFWDYVIVEGKKLGTNEWKPFLDGYDSRAQATWFGAYNRGIPAGSQNSGRNGDVTQFRERTIDLLANGNFATQDTVLIRFRLFSDPAARGWGWVLDNLQIQDIISAVDDYIFKEDFKIYPNPTEESITVSLDLISVSNQIEITLQDILGRTIDQRIIDRPSRIIREDFSLGGLESGMYIIQIGFNDRDKISKKVFKQ